MAQPGFSIRLARADETAALEQLIERSVRVLQAGDYTQAQLDGALASVFGVDSQLVADGTYFVVEDADGVVAGCGGWSKRKTLYGGDRWVGRLDELLDPAVDAAKIRAFFVHPDFARRGVGTMILDACESSAMAAGFRRCEMGATLTGVRLFQARGYVEAERIAVPLSNGELLPVVHMAKDLLRINLDDLD